MSNPRAPLDIAKAQRLRASWKCGWCQGPVDVPQKGWAHRDDGAGALCSKCHDVDGRHPWVIGQHAITKALALHHTPAEALTSWPWQALNDLAGPLVPGRLTYVAAFPGNGKTTFLTHCIAYWLEQGKTITYLPLESDASEVMARMACHRTGVSADDALSMRLRQRADAGDQSATAQLNDLEVCYRLLQEDTELLYALRIEPIQALTLASFQKAVRATEVMESDLLVVDHVDHVEHEEGEGSSEIQLSNRLQAAALSAAKRLNIPVVLASQLNSSRTGGDRLAHYRPPLMDWLYNKGKKDQMASVCLGLYRPMDPDADADLTKRVREGHADPGTVLLANRMGVCGMKLRFGGAQKEKTTLLEYAHGTIRDLAAPDIRALHASSTGIYTGRGASEFGEGLG